ncbi:hypothetical protein B0H11DRAFT_1902347 [Mycena galericulata]|nr:hypothetical protein B0H11DRAFT_1902347 [Mycena galericulata]
MFPNRVPLMMATPTTDGDRVPLTMWEWTSPTPTLLVGTPLTAHERALTIASLSLKSSQLRGREEGPRKRDGQSWSSNETTPTGDAGFPLATVNNVEGPKKPSKKLSNAERRDNLVKFWEVMKACGMTVPPRFSILTSTGTKNKERGRIFRRGYDPKGSINMSTVFKGCHGRTC